MPGHEIPAGELVTEPLPVTVTLSVCGGCGVKTAVSFTELSSLRILSGLRVEQPDNQQINSCPGEGDAVRVTAAPVEKEAEHVPGQEIPAGELVTEPSPLIVMVMVSLAEAFVASPDIATKQNDNPINRHRKVIERINCVFLYLSSFSQNLPVPEWEFAALVQVHSSYVK